VYGGKKLSLFEKAVLELLKEEPKQRKHIVRELCPRIMSKKKLQMTLNELEDAGRVKAISRRIEGSRRWTTWYALPGHEYLLDVDSGRVIAAIERMWAILPRPPTSEEIAVEIGITPDAAEKLGYKVAPQTGWFPPSPEMIEEATTKLGEALVLATRMRLGINWIEKYNYRDDPDIPNMAERYLQKCPEMLPSLTKDGDWVESWPSEALKYLKRNYQPKERYYRRVLIRAC